jgi:hypothetical protein
MQVVIKSLNQKGKLMRIQIATLALYTFFVASQAFSKDNAWKIDASHSEENKASPKNGVKIEDNDAKKILPSNVPFSETMGITVMAKKNDDDVALAFGLKGPTPYLETVSAAGTVTKLSLRDVLRNQFSAVAGILPSYSKCGGKDLNFAQSVVSSSSKNLIYGLRQTCNEQCFVTVENQTKDGKLIDTTNEYPVDKTICQKVIGG